MADAISFDDNGNLIISSYNNTPGILIADSSGKVTPSGSFVSSTPWTPVLNFDGDNTDITYTTQTGSYTRLGDLVFFTLNIVLSDNGSTSGSVTITGLPVPCSGSYPLHIVYENINITSPGDSLSAMLKESTININFINSLSAMSDLTNTSVSKTASFNISGTYIAGV